MQQNSTRAPGRVSVGLRFRAFRSNQRALPFEKPLYLRRKGARPQNSTRAPRRLSGVGRGLRDLGCRVWILGGCVFRDWGLGFMVQG